MASPPLTHDPAPTAVDDFAVGAASSGVSAASATLRERDESFARAEALRDEWVSLGKQVAALEARRAKILADRLDMLTAERGVTLGGREMALRSLCAEYAAEARIAPGSMEARFADGWFLARALPETWAALREGRISKAHADAIMAESPSSIITGTDDVASVEEAVRLRAAYEEQVLPFAEGDAPARTRVHARGVTVTLCPQTIAEEHRRARAERAVTVKPDGEGMAVLTAILPEVLAYAVHDRLTAMARAVVKARPTSGPASTAPRGAASGVRAGRAASRKGAGLVDLLADDSSSGQFLDGRDMDPATSSDENPYGRDDAVGTGIDIGPARVGDDARTGGDAGANGDAGSGVDAGAGADDSTAEDVRTMDQVRADIFADMLLTTSPASVVQTGEK